MLTSINLKDMKEIAHSNINWNKLNKKTVLITGATGMIPSYMVMSLLYLNKNEESFQCKIIAIVRSEKKAKALFGEFWKKTYFEVVVLDISKPIELEDSVDYIIHGASPASPQLFTTKPVDTIYPNVLGTNNLLAFAVEKSTQGFLLLSSGDVYGQIPEGNIITEGSLGIVDQLNTRNSYAESKRMAEMFCRAYMEQYGVPTKIARISHTYGPTVSFENDRRVFSEFVQNIVNGQNIVMQSAGTAVRPFCYLTDATIALFTILLEGDAGTAYNLCNDECSVSIKELAECLVRIFPERKLQVICKERDKNDTYQESLVKKPCMVDNSKLRALGWKPAIGLEEGFRRVIGSIEEGRKIN